MTENGRKGTGRQEVWKGMAVVVGTMAVVPGSIGRAGPGRLGTEKLRKV